MESALVASASKCVQESEHSDSVLAVSRLLRHTCVDFLLRPKEVPRHVRRVARREIREYVGIKFNGLLEERFGWSLVLESVVPLDFFR